ERSGGEESESENVSGSECSEVSGSDEEKKSKKRKKEKESPKKKEKGKKKAKEVAALNQGLANLVKMQRRGKSKGGEATASPKKEGKNGSVSKKGRVKSPSRKSHQ